MKKGYPIQKQLISRIYDWLLKDTTVNNLNLLVFWNPFLLKIFFFPEIVVPCGFYKQDTTYYNNILPSLVSPLFGFSFLLLICFLSYCGVQHNTLVFFFDFLYTVLFKVPFLAPALLPRTQRVVGGCVAGGGSCKVEESTIVAGRLQDLNLHYYVQWPGRGKVLFRQVLIFY